MLFFSTSLLFFISLSEVGECMRGMMAQWSGLLPQTPRVGDLNMTSGLLAWSFHVLLCWFQYKRFVVDWLECANCREGLSVSVPHPRCPLPCAPVLLASCNKCSEVICG